MKKVELSPSIMCARNLLDINKDLDVFKSSNINMIHVDIMDGHFVPNLTFGPDIVNTLSTNRRNNEFVLDLHLMVTNPEQIITRMNLEHDDIVTIHSEINKEHLEQTIALLHEKNIRVGLALNPKTEFEEIKPYLDDIDLILLMFVEPGFAGARPVPKVINKLKIVTDWLNKLHYDDMLVSVDGGISIERAKECREYGANVFVGGTSSIYKRNENGKLSNNKFKQNIDQFLKEVV